MASTDVAREHKYPSDAENSSGAVGEIVCLFRGRPGTTIVGPASNRFPRETSRDLCLGPSRQLSLTNIVKWRSVAVMTMLIPMRHSKSGLVYLDHHRQALRQVLLGPRARIKHVPRYVSMCSTAILLLTSGATGHTWEPAHGNTHRGHRVTVEEVDEVCLKRWPTTMYCDRPC